MAWDPSKDTLLWQTPEMSPSGMFINIKQYANYPPKVEFARAVTFNGQQSVKGAGRLDTSDLVFLTKYLPIVQQQLQQYGGNQSTQQQNNNQSPIPGQQFSGFSQ